MEAMVKENVKNPLSYRNTVGAELADILEIRGLENYEELLGVKDLRRKEKLSETIRKRAALILDDAGLVSYLQRFETSYLEDKPRYLEKFKEANKFFNSIKDIIPLLKNEYNDGYDRLEDVLDFFGVDTEEEIIQASKGQVAMLRSQNRVNVNPINLAGWLRRGELDFKTLSLNEYDENKLLEWVDGKEWSCNIEDAEYFKSLPEKFALFGVALVFVPSLKNIVYGAIRWIDGHPLIQISDRYQDLATCWFTLFHEIGHAIKHRNIDIYDACINDSKAIQNRRESEANKFANKYLFNGDDLRKNVFDRKRNGIPMTFSQLAEEFGVHPLFTSHWLIKAQYNPSFQKRVHIDFANPYQ